MLIKQVDSDVILYGNGYLYIERADGMIVGLSYLPGDQVTIYHNDATGEFYFMYKGLKIEDKDILHFYKNTYDGIVGISLLKFASRTIYLANSAEDAAAEYFSSGLNINAIIHATAPLT
jgi:phage portal protein BeeE